MDIMNEVIIRIRWDGKDEPLLSDPDSIKEILEAYCPNLDLKVTKIVIITPNRLIKKGDFKRYL